MYRTRPGDIQSELLMVAFFQDPAYGCSFHAEMITVISNDQRQGSASDRHNVIRPPRTSLKREPSQVQEIVLYRFYMTSMGSVAISSVRGLSEAIVVAPEAVSLAVSV